MASSSVGDDVWIDLMPGGAVVQNAQLSILRFNEAALAALGLSEQELTGRTSLDERWHAIREDRSHFPGNDHPAAVALATGKSVKSVLMGVFHPQDSKYHWLRVSSYPMNPEDPPDSRLVYTTFDDVTAWKEAEESRQKEQELLWGGSVVFLSWAGNPAVLTSVSPNFEKLFHLDPKPYLGVSQAFLSRYHENDQKALEQQWARVWADPAARQVSGRFRFLDGASRWREVSFHALVDRGGPDRGPSTLEYWIDRTEEVETLSRLALTLEAAGTGTWDWIREKDRLIVDAQWANLVGAPLEDFSDLTLAGWRNLVHPSDLAAWDAVDQAVASGDQVAFDIDLRFRHRSGKWVWTRVRGKVHEATAEGAPLRVLGTQEDISDLVFAQQERAVLSQVVEQGPSAVLITDLAGTIEYVNREFSTMTGYTLQEVQGKNPRLLKSPRTPPETYFDLWSTLKAGKAWFGEFQNVKKDGTPYWVQASINPITDSSGQVYRYVGQHLDITARKLVEEASRAQYRFQVFLTQTAARLVNIRGEVVPQALGEILGDLGGLFQADRVFFGFLTASGSVFNVRNGWDRSGAPLPASIPLDDSPLWRKRILSREPVLSVGLPCPVPWSARMAAALLAIPLEGGMGDPGFLVLEAWNTRPAWNAEVQVSVTVVANTLSAFMKRVIDEQDLKKARQEADQANQAKSDFLAHMSHEIRTPMNGILGLAELTLGKDLDRETRSLVEGIKASGETLLSLVNDILDVSKIEAGKLELEKTALSLREVVGATLAPLKVLAAKKGLSLADGWDDPTDYREGDPTRIRQILTNLIGNAIKFTSRGGVTVRVTPGTGDTVKFSVQDTGPGVPPDRQNRLFQRYSQTEASTTRKFGGTGLGLAICRELVERMGGEIGYEDALDPPGGIFWFTIELPVGTEPAPALSPVPVPASVQGAPHRKLRVLVVEDNLVNQQVASGLLRKHEIEPELASDGVAALEKLLGSPFDLILMDVQMPVLDGMATTRAIRRGEGGERNRHVPIVAMTANAMQGDREATLAAGMDDYVTKPVSAAKIDALLAKWDRTHEPLSAEERRKKTFDPEEMRQRLQLEEEFVRQIVQLFLDDLPVRRKSLTEALAQNRTGEIQRLAHTLKGTAANLVAQGVVETAEELETASGKKDEEKIPGLHAALLAEVDLLEASLTEFLR